MRLKQKRLPSSMALFYKENEVILWCVCASVTVISRVLRNHYLFSSYILSRYLPTWPSETQCCNFRMPSRRLRLDL